MDLKKINTELKEKNPKEIIEWALSLNKKAILTTNFGPHEAAIIRLATSVQPDVPVVWIDSTFNTKATYAFADKLINQFNLNLKVYKPNLSGELKELLKDGLPNVTSEYHEDFSNQVKLEPFDRAFNEIKPEVWITAIRKEQTAFRGSLDIVTEDDRGIIKVAPIFYWTEAELENYLNENNLPIEKDYFDPVKALGNRECGIHVPRKKTEE